MRKKTIYTLNLNPDQYKEITDLTYPWMIRWAKKIGADFVEIRDRQFPEWRSPTYEKCQVYKLAQERGDEWAIFLDADAIVHPDTPDFTCLIPKDTIMHNGMDFAAIRWKYDKYFLRDGRNIGTPSWLCIASEWCLDLFHPLEDLTPDEAYSNIFPIRGEELAGYEPWRLIEDYVFSRNIARYGLKFKSVQQLIEESPKLKGEFFWHQYAMPIEQKIVEMERVLKNWRLI